MNQRTERFGDVMTAFPFDNLWELLNNPHSIDTLTFEQVINWCRPKVPSGILCFDAFADVVVKSSLFASRAEVIRKVREGAMKWNGRRVTDANMTVGFLNPGWGVIQLGKRTHKVVLEEK